MVQLERSFELESKFDTEKDIAEMDSKNIEPLQDSKVGKQALKSLKSKSPVQSNVLDNSARKSLPNQKRSGGPTLLPRKSKIKKEGLREESAAINTLKNKESEEVKKDSGEVEETKVSSLEAGGRKRGRPRLKEGVKKSIGEMEDLKIGGAQDSNLESMLTSEAESAHISEGGSSEASKVESPQVSKMINPQSPKKEKTLSPKKDNIEITTKAKSNNTESRLKPSTRIMTRKSEEKAKLEEASLNMELSTKSDEESPKTNLKVESSLEEDANKSKSKIEENEDTKIVTVSKTPNLEETQKGILKTSSLKMEVFVRRSPRNDTTMEQIPKEGVSKSIQKPITFEATPSKPLREAAENLQINNESPQSNDTVVKRPRGRPRLRPSESQSENESATNSETPDNSKGRRRGRPYKTAISRTMEIMTKALAQSPTVELKSQRIIARNASKCVNVPITQKNPNIPPIGTQESSKRHSEEEDEKADSILSPRRKILKSYADKSKKIQEDDKDAKNDEAPGPDKNVTKIVKIPSDSKKLPKRAEDIDPKKEKGRTMKSLKIQIEENIVVEPENLPKEEEIIVKEPKTFAREEENVIGNSEDVICDSESFDDDIIPSSQELTPSTRRSTRSFSKTTKSDNSKDTFSPDKKLFLSDFQNMEDKLLPELNKKSPQGLTSLELSLKMANSQSDSTAGIHSKQKLDLLFDATAKQIRSSQKRIKSTAKLNNSTSKLLDSSIDTLRKDSSTEMIFSSNLEDSSKKLEENRQIDATPKLFDSAETIPMLTESTKGFDESNDTNTKFELSATLTASSPNLTDTMTKLFDSLESQSEKLESQSERNSLKGTGQSDGKIEDSTQNDFPKTKSTSQNTTLTAYDASRSLTPEKNVELDDFGVAKRNLLAELENFVAEMDTQSCILTQTAKEDTTLTLRTQDRLHEENLLNGSDKLEELTLPRSKKPTSEEDASAETVEILLQEDYLPSSPVTGDTPNRNNELLDSTMDISPIKSPGSTFGPIKLFLGLNDEELGIADSTNKEVSKTDDNPVSCLKGPSSRSAKLLNLLPNAPTMVGLVSHKQTAVIKQNSSVNSSPKTDRIRRMMMKYGGDEDQEGIANSEVEEVFEVVDREDVLEFTKVLPNSTATPRSSILKRKVPDTVEDGFSPCAKV